MSAYNVCEWVTHATGKLSATQLGIVFPVVSPFSLNHTLIEP